MIAPKTPEPTADPYDSWCAQARAIEKKLKQEDQLIHAFYAEPFYLQLLASKIRQGKRRRGAYADPRSELWLLDATMWAMLCLANYRAAGRAPIMPSAADWREAVQALETLIKLERRGIPLSPDTSLAPLVSMPVDWLPRLRVRVQAAASAAKKPHADATVVEREACRKFVERLYWKFNRSVAPVLLTRFADLIGYSSEKLIRVYLKDWLYALDADG